MATRKPDAPEVVAEPAPYDTGLDARDITFDRLRIVGKQSKLADATVCPHPTIEDAACARIGDLAIGGDAEDVDSRIIRALKGNESVRFHVLKVHANYACKFGGPKGQWDEGDPEMPADAKRQYNVFMYVVGPNGDPTFPIVYTASGTAAGKFRKVNTAIGRASIGGTAPYELAWEMTTVINTAGDNSWPGPVFVQVQPVPADVEKAKVMHDKVFGQPRAQLASGSDDDGTPGF